MVTLATLGIPRSFSFISRQRLFDGLSHGKTHKYSLFDEGSNVLDFMAKYSVC